MTINDFNNTVVPYPKEKTIYGLFEEQVLVHPNAIAIRKGKKTITYDELNKRSNRLANFLIANGVVPEDNVGLLVSRDFDMIIGMLGILKAGGAYVPIDPDYPIDRQEYIFNQSSLRMVVANGDYPLKSLIPQQSFLRVNFEDSQINKDVNPGLNISSSQLAYTIYTSGSTGRPKGVMIEHHSAVNLVLWVNEEFNVGPADRLLFITSMCFDLSVYDIFGMLAAGGSLVIAENTEVQNVRTLQTMLVDYGITFWDSVPTTLDYLVRNLEQEHRDYQQQELKTIFLSGDWIPVDLPERIKPFFPNARLISLGGATEATVWSNYFPVDRTNPTWKSIPYGRPIYNNFFYILNERFQPVPVGEIGDLYIGGAGVARGYAGDSEKTVAAFVPDPFNTSLGGVMYRTGDLGRMMLDFNMEFLGRKDNQVKINGFRIELGEIESVLNSNEYVTSAIVLAKDGPNGKQLVGYIEPKGKFVKETLVSFLKTKLPDYMVPTVWVEVAKMPLTSNGKIDRKALANLKDSSASTKVIAAPTTETEKILAAIWKECMGLTECSIDDNFFALGGHSLMAVQILSALEKKTGICFQLAILFKYPDIRSLASFIDREKQKEKEKEEVNYKSLVAIKPTGTKPPLYIIHGDGLNVLNFSSLASCMDQDQPIFGLQAKGLDGIDETPDTMADIARFYLSEILTHNPTGPYLLAGYSFGGYVAVEMQKQMIEMGKEVTMLIMLDTDAEKTEYKDWIYLLPRKVKRKFPIYLSILKSSLLEPVSTFKKQFKNNQHRVAPEYSSKKNSKGFYQLIKKIKTIQLAAFRSYLMTPFDSEIYLYRANICVHYVDEKEFLGWKTFAKNGVIVREVPGDHLSMLLSPNVQELAVILQKDLDECTKKIETPILA